MKKGFDEIILELPEINLNEKRTRYGNCHYGIDEFGGCYDMPEVIVTGNRTNNNDGGGGIVYIPSGGPGGGGPGGSPGGGGGGGSSPQIKPKTGEWVDQPCAGCSELEQPRPTFTPLGRALLPLHNTGCGGQYRVELRHKVWQEYDNCQ